MKMSLLISIKMPTFQIRQSAEHEHFSANKYENANYCWHSHIY